MKTFLISCVAIASLSSCAPTVLVNKDELRAIPKGSTKVIALTEKAPEEAYIEVSKIFAKNGCPVSNNKESMQVVCNGKSVEGGTTLKAMALIEEEGAGSKVTISGEWGLDAMGQAGMSAFGAHGMSGTNKIVWEGIYPTKPCIAFQHMVKLAKEVSGGELSYKK